MTTPERTIRLVQTKSSGYRVVPATGVWGGVTPGGLVRVDFYLDTIRPEEASALPVEPDGKIRMAAAEAAMERYLERETQVGIAMSLETAERIATWLLEKVSQAKANEKSNAANT